MALARHQFSIVDQQGNVVPNAYVEVRTELPGMPLAALKADRDGAIGKTNPCQADANGFVFFYVVGGAYSIRSYLGAPEAPTFQTETWRYVAIGRNAESDGIGIPTQRVVTEAGDVIVASDDADEIIINKDVGEPTTVRLPLVASRLRSYRIIDGKGDAATNNITIVPQPGEKIYTVADYELVIDGTGASATVTPRQDGGGWT